MSQFFKSKEKEVSIFGKWQIQEPRLRVGKQRFQQQSKPEQVRRAEEVLNDAQLLYSNINSFLKEKIELIQKIQGHKAVASQLLEEIYGLNNSKNKNLADQENIIKRIRQILQQVYRVIREGQALEDYVSNYFQNANLANYDPRIHQLKNTKTYVQAENELVARIEQIRIGCSNLFRSLHYIDKLDAVFSKEQSFNYCLINLQQLISHDSLVKIHGLMIRQLIEVDQRKKQFLMTNRSVEAEYMKYELVYDCLQLMKIERQEIFNQMKLFERDFEHVTRYVPIQGRGLLDHNDLMLEQTLYRQTMQKINQSQMIADTNLKVYRVNIQNFTRVSAQTSLYCYSLRLAQFTEMLTQFERYFANWKINLTTLRYLYDRRNSLLTYRDQKNIKKVFSQSDRQFLIHLYEQVRDRKTGNNKNLQFYQQDVLTDIQKQLKMNNIAYTVRQIQPSQVKAMLQKQNQFFQNLSKIHPTNKVFHIKQNKNNINVLIFELQQLMAQGLINDAAFEIAIQFYAAALSYCQIIASSQTYEQQLRMFERILNEGKSYQQMPYGMTELALSYVHDLNIIVKSQIEKQSLHIVYLEQFGLGIQAQIRQKRKPNIEQAVEKNIYKFNQLWISLYARYYRFITLIGEELILDELKQMGLLITQKIKMVLQTVKEVVEINANKLQIEKSQFFTYKVLLPLYEMVNQKKTPEQLQKFKIQNLHIILQTLFEYLDQKFLSKPVNLQLNDLIKITIIQFILQKIYKQNDYHRIIRTLRLQLYLQNLSVVYPENIQHTLISQNWIHPLLKIQFRMRQISYIGNDMKTKSIVDKLNLLLPQIRKLPLALSTKQDIFKFIEAFQVSYYIGQLESAYEGRRYGISEAAVGLVGLRAIYQSFMFVQTHFQSYENTVINQKRKISIFFEQLKQSITKLISKIKERDVLHRHFIDAKNSVTLKVGLTRLFGFSSYD